MTQGHGQEIRYPDPPDVEVLICTHNRVDLLERTLQSINSSDMPDDCQIGVFVVANACTDSTVEFLSQYTSTTDANPDGGRPPGKSRLPMRWIEDPIPGKSHALNLALPQAIGTVITFVDDDHRVAPGYLRAVCEAARHYPDADLFCGRIYPDWDGTEPGWVHDQGPYRIYPLPVPRFELGDTPKRVTPGIVTPGGGNLAIRRGMFEKIGMFHLDLGPKGHDLGGAEDIEWVRRALSLGTTLYYVPDMLQYHYVDASRLTLSYIMRKAYERSASTTRLSGAHNSRHWPPPFMIRKVLTYFLMALTAFSNGRRRFYLTRLSASLGEIKGFLIQKRITRENNRKITTKGNT